MARKPNFIAVNDEPEAPRGGGTAKGGNAPKRTTTLRPGSTGKGGNAPKGGGDPRCTGTPRRGDTGNGATVPNSGRTARAAKAPTGPEAPGRNDPPRISGAPAAAANPDAVIMALAAKQHGVVSRAQLLKIGIPVHAIDFRRRKGRLQSLHRGVYRVGPISAAYEREMVAVLACGETALLSHRSAAVLWDLLPSTPRDTPVEVIVQQRPRNPGRWVRVRLAKPLDPDEKTHKLGIPITAPARTILDLAGTVSGRDLEQALAAARRLSLANVTQVQGLLKRYPRRWGTRTLQALLNQTTESAFTRSEAESRFLSLIRGAKLREPKVNVKLKGYEVDFLWRREKVVVEIDGYAYHSSRRSFESDRRRDGVLAAAGFRVVRITWRQLTDEHDVVLVLLAQALARTGGG